MYNQSNLNLEVLILKDLQGKEFYKSKMDLEIQTFIRPE